MPGFSRVNAKEFLEVLKYAFYVAAYQYMSEKCCRYLQTHKKYIDGLVQDCSNSSASVMELMQSCIKGAMRFTKS